MHPSTVRLKALFRECSYQQLKPLYDMLEDNITGRCKSPDELADELCLWGSNTIASLLRWWAGVSYLEVVTDVAKALDVELSSSTDERDHELQILANLIQKHFENATPAQREEIKQLLEKEGSHFDYSTLFSGSSNVILKLLTTVGRKATQNAVKQVMTMLVGRQATRQGVKVMGRYVGLAIPYVNIVFAAWLVIDIAGPAYRKTVPAVVQVALLRLEHEGKEN